MSNDALRDLARQLRSRRIDRRQFAKGAAALGASATAISSALRIAPARAQDAGKVVFWTTHTAGTDLDTLNGIVSDFNQQNPDVQTELVAVPGSETDTTKLMTAVRGGTGPDVYMLDRFIVAQRAHEGVLQELTEFAGTEVTADQYIDFAWAEANLQDKLFALPFDTDARAIYYNKGILGEAGIDVATLDAANGPFTVDKLYEINDAVNQTDQDGNYSRMGFVPWFSQGWHYTWGFAYGGTFFDEAECQVTPDDDGVVAGFQFGYDFAKKYDPQKIDAFIRPAMAPDAPPEQNPFFTSRVALICVGDWFIAQSERYAADIDYGITFIPVPTPEAESATWAGGWSMVIPEGANNPEGAWRFMRYIAGEPGQRKYTVETTHLPTYKSLLADASLFGEEHKFFADGLIPVAKNRPPLPVGAKYWNELTTAWEKAYLNTEEPAEALKTVKERVQPDLDASGYCG